MTSIAIVDDHKLFASGLALLLDELAGDLTIRSYTSAQELAAGGADKLSLIVLDFYLPGSSFSDSFQLLQDTFACPIVVVSASPSPADQRQALAAGAATFISKHAEPDELLSSLQDVLSGIETGSLHSTAAISFKEFGLTERQFEILLLVAKGYTNKEIAAAFKISPETVKSHMKSIFRSVKVENRIEAIEFVRDRGLL